MYSGTGQQSHFYNREYWLFSQKLYQRVKTNWHFFTFSQTLKHHVQRLKTFSQTLQHHIQRLKTFRQTLRRHVQRLKAFCHTLQHHF